MRSRLALALALPLVRPEVAVEADTDLGLVEPVRGARVTASVASPDGASHQFRLRQRDGYLALGWVAWTDSGGAFVFEGLSPAVYELLLAGSDGDSWPVRVDSLSDQIDLGQLVSSAGNLLTVSFLTPSVLEIDLRPTVSLLTLGPDGEVERRERRFEFHDRGSDGSFLWRGLPPGDYEVAIWDDRGNRWGHEVLQAFGQDHHYVDLDAVPLVGRIQRGGEPLGLELAPERGSLRVPRWQDGSGSRNASFFHDARLVTPGGATIRVGTLAAVNDRGQVQEDGDEGIVRDLAPGTYSYCPKDGACSRVEVVPWGESRVRE